MKQVLFVVASLLSIGSFAQTFPFDLWHDGKIVLESGDTIRGLVKYDLQDILQLKHQGKLESYTARKVVFFEIFDEYYKRYRQFYSLPYAAVGGYKSPIFFESLCEGRITVLTREKIEYRSYASPYYGYGGYASRMVLVNIFYLLKENGSIQEFTGRKNDWYDLMANKQNDIHDYVKENRLDFDRKYDLKRIVDYYNSTSHSK